MVHLLIAGLPGKLVKNATKAYVEELFDTNKRFVSIRNINKVYSQPQRNTERGKGHLIFALISVSTSPVFCRQINLFAFGGTLQLASFDV